MQASVLACKGSMCHPKRERKKENAPALPFYRRYVIELAASVVIAGLA